MHFRLPLAFAVCALMGALAHPVTSAERPNVIVFLADDLGQRDLGCYGSSFYDTPNLDRLARDGMKFTQAYAACPVCSPTRASYLTGRWPQRTGVTDYIGAAQPANWKLIERYENGTLEPYNLARDLPERVNLAEAEPALARSMQARLAAWREDVGAKMPVPNPNARKP